MKIHNPDRQYIFMESHFNKDEKLSLSLFEYIIQIYFEYPENRDVTIRYLMSKIHPGRDAQTDCEELELTEAVLPGFTEALVSLEYSELLNFTATLIEKEYFNVQENFRAIVSRRLRGLPFFRSPLKEDEILCWT